MAVFIDQEAAGLVLDAGQECFEGRKGIMRLVDEVGALNLPKRRRVVVVVVAQFVAILEDAAYLGAWQGKYLAIVLPLIAVLGRRL